MVAVNICNTGQMNDLRMDGFTTQYVSARLSKLGQKCEVTNYIKDGDYGVFGVWIEGDYRTFKLRKLKKPFSGFS